MPDWRTADEGPGGAPLWWTQLFIEAAGYMIYKLKCQCRFVHFLGYELVRAVMFQHVVLQLWRLSPIYPKSKEDGSPTNASMGNLANRVDRRSSRSSLRWFLTLRLPSYDAIVETPYAERSDSR